MSRAEYVEQRHIAENALEALRVAEHRAREAESRAIAAEARAQAAEERSVKVLAEARLVLSDAFALSRKAADALYGQQVPVDLENPPSVGEADRNAARRLRDTPGIKR